MSRKGFLKRHPEVLFVLLSYVFVVAAVVLVRSVDLPWMPLLVLGSWTPTLAAWIVLGPVLRERRGLQRLLAGWGKWRVGLRWYLIALSPLFLVPLAARAYLVAGGRASEPVQSAGPALLMSAATSLITGAMGEEPGWRGFLLPRLQERFNALTSSLIVGGVWALWHLPLWFLPGGLWDAVPYWAFSLAAIASSVLFTFVHNNTGGSLLMATVIHFAFNFGVNAAGILGWLPPPSVGWPLISLVYSVYAVVIVIAAGPAELSMTRRVAGGSTQGAATQP
jgi:membrane protease YdiL (CAAX protease family)